MSYGQWTPNWRIWRNWETGNARNWQTEATSSAGNWLVPAPPVWNWQTGMPPPPPPPPPPTPPANRYTGPALYWNRQNAMATRDGWRTGNIDSIGNWQTQMIPERNWHSRPNYYNTWNWHTRPNRRAWNWQIRPNRRRSRAWNWQIESLPRTNWQTQQEDYIPFFPLGLALPPPLVSTSFFSYPV